MQCDGDGQATADLAGLLERLVALDPGDISEVAHDAARILIADSVICGVAAAHSRRTTMSANAAGTAPGRSEMVGHPGRTRSLDAAWVNADAMNLLDADDTFFNGGHFGSLIVATALAQAQGQGRSWAQLSTAVVAGFEVVARIQLASRSSPGSLLTPGLLLPGATLAAVVADGRPRIVHDALGLAIRFAPAPAARQHALASFDSVKYAPYGLLAWQAIMATALAAQGYRERPWTAGGPGLFALQSSTIDVDWLRRPASDDWWIQHTSLKRYPSFRLGHSVLDALREILMHHSTASDDIVAITAYVDPRALNMPFYATEIDRFPVDARTPIRVAMHLRYCLALVALGVPPGPSWSDREQVTSEAVWSLVKRIHLSEQPARSSDWIREATEPTSGRVRGSVGRVRLTTHQREWEHEVTEVDGDPWNPATRPGWEWLARKADSFGVDQRIVDLIHTASPDIAVGTILAMA